MDALCFWSICFAPLEANLPKLFGFPEFLAALALSVLAWTNADYRYRFRVSTAPIPIYGITFAMVMSIGTLTLLTDLWRAEQWLVPRGNLVSSAQWQAFLGALFLANFALWIWFAFISPPSFGRWNATRFGNVLFRGLVKGNPDELSVIAEEMSRSAASLVRYSWEGWALRDFRSDRGESELYKSPQTPKTRAYEVLQMIGDKKFCRTTATASPGTIAEFFVAIAEQRKFSIPIGAFATNITEAAIADKNSFVYHEVDGYQSGYFGHYKPITSSLYGNFEVAERIERLFDISYAVGKKWDGDHWEAYTRLVLACLRDYVESGHMLQRSHVLYRAIDHIATFIKFSNASGGTDGIDFTETPTYWKLKVTVGFIRQSIEIVEKVDEKTIESADHDDYGLLHHLADLMTDVVFAASTVKAPQMTAWAAQYNMVWSEFFGFRTPGVAESKIHSRFFRLLLKELSHMDHGPNYKGARILGMLLNVMGLELHKHQEGKSFEHFHRLVLWWTKRNFAALYESNPEILEECLPANISYDPESFRIVKTYAKGLNREAPKRYLQVDAHIRTQ